MSKHAHKQTMIEILSVVDRFRETVDRFSSRTAVCCGDSSLTYNELDRRSDALAELLAAKGVGSGDVVGLCCKKRIELPIALLAILKVGAAYVPFDASYPSQRLAEMANTAKIRFLIGKCEALDSERYDSIQFEEFPSSSDSDSKFKNSQGDSIAYVMFTSGSTGQPKGVAVPHRAIIRLVTNPNYCQLGPEEVILQHSPVAFDASTFEIWGALLNGARLVIHQSDSSSLRDLGNTIKKYQVTTAWLTSGLFNAFVDERIEDLAGLKQLLTGGDIVSPSHAKTLLKRFPDIRLINGYGPTENTTFTCCHTISLKDVTDLQAIPIGKPISGTQIHIVDEQLKPVKPGSVGELCASGSGVAIGYWNNPELTAEKFVPIKIKGRKVRVYRTGDQVQQREDGVIEFLGRIDQQVKIRGFRIEIGEIELAISKMTEVANVVVVAEAFGQSADKTLIAHYVSDSDIPKEVFIRKLAKDLPNHSIPAFFSRIDELPLNPNGKVDKRALPDLNEILKQDAPHQANETSDLVQLIRETFSTVLERPDIQPRINFFDLGASSLQIARIHERLQTELQTEFPITHFFEYPTISELADSLAECSTTEDTVNFGSSVRNRDEMIAIVGMAGRFPGANNIEEFWQNLVDGKETISRFSAEELDFENANASGSSSSSLYVRARGIVDGSDQFDAAHFNIPPKEAEDLDPQHRLMLECAQSALESANCDPDRHEGKIGLFCGASQNSYLLSNHCSDPEFSKQLAAGYPTNNLNALIGNDKDFIPTRVAYKLNLRGPAVSVQCACSTSLIAVAQACESLRAGTSDMALAGGVSLGFPQKRDYLYTEDGIASKDGHCRTFDKQATGTVFGEGVGLVVLKRLSDALADGDEITAVIRGFAVNNDGSDKVGYAAPSITGQADVILEAQKNADISAESIGYVEAHGTATPLGDPIEVAALNKAFQKSTSKKHFCFIGTGKTNVGHLDIAAGITGLIKTALTVHNAKIPPLLHLEEVNPNIDFENSPFVPSTELINWDSESPRRAGVSAFGIGGTNIHMIVEQAPVVQGIRRLPNAYGNVINRTTSSIFPISASSPEAVAETASNLAAFLSNNREIDIDRVAYTLQECRRSYNHRAVLLAPSVAELIKTANNFSGRAFTCQQGRNIVFMMPGQGAQHSGMAGELYETEPVFREALDHCCELIEDEIGVDILSILYPVKNQVDEMADRLRNTNIAQPAIFAIEYCLAQQWKHWGLTPACMIGHSIGEFAAACIAGIFSLEDAIKLICLRGQLMADLEGGAMISVRAAEDQVQPFLNDHINLAAINGAKACVLAGPYDAADRVEKELQNAGLEAKRLHTSHAFHSSMMDSIVAPFHTAVEKVTLNKPSIPILSTVTAKWLTDAEAIDPDYWASHLRKPVRFYQAIQELWKLPENVFLEVGPGHTLATLARQNPNRKVANPSLSSLPHPNKQCCSYHYVKNTLGELWANGIDLDWNKVEERVAHPKPIALPSYPFQRKRYWKTCDVPREQVSQNPYIDSRVSNTTPENTNVTEMVLNTKTPSSENPIEQTLKEVFADLSGFAPEEIDGSTSFLELGFDSLLLTQAGKEIQDEFKVKVSMRQLIDEYSSLDELVKHIDSQVDPNLFAKPNPAADVNPQQQPLAQPTMPAPMPMPLPLPGSQTGEAQPMMIPMYTEMGYCMVPVMPVAQPIPMAMPGMPAPAQTQPPVAPQQPSPTTNAKVEDNAASKPVSGPTTVIDRSSNDSELTEQQRKHIDQLIFRYTEKTIESKNLTQKYRQFHADPRTASGFNRVWKEMVYQIVTTESKGSRLLDVDGNEYIDILNGFGPGFLGHSTDFLVEAVEQQLHKGYEVGPQSLLAMEAAELFCQVTGNERTSFVCTGSEAVQAAMRLARTVTKRDKIVIFARDYHGNFDEVLVRDASRNGIFKTLPTAPGIPKGSTSNMLVLPYGTDESLEIIRGMADELAAVIIEPVQSRRPEFRPRDFIREVREITHNSGSLFIFDEVVTGFRFGPRGAQDFYGIEADLCTYGKVIGGGMPLGVVSGKAEYMDTFDGGHWQYGDDSFPEQPVTFFAGTFVRHPLAMASVKAMLNFFKEQPQHFWSQMNAKGDRLAGTVDRFFKENNIPIEMPNCGSLMFVRMGENQKYGNLLFYHLREKGVFLLEGFPSYMTAAHDEEDIDYAISAFKEATYEMQSAGFFEPTDASRKFKGPKLNGPSPRLSDPRKKNSDGKIQQLLNPVLVPTTEPQREVLAASKLNELASCAFNESASLLFKGKLDIAALEYAFEQVVDRHDMLRATFAAEALQMKIHAQMDISIKHVDLREDPDSLDSILKQDAATPYDLETGPLVRPQLYRLADEEFAFVISAHHLVCDGWSYNVIAEELSELYNAQVEGRRPLLDSAKQYVVYAKELAEQKESSQFIKDKEYWVTQFGELPEPIDLPIDRSYRTNRSFSGSTYTTRIDQQQYQAVKKAGASLGSTMYATLGSIYQLMLHRLTGQDDLVICIPSAGQNSGKDTDNLVGHCVNFLPLRTKYSKDQTFADFLAHSRSVLLEASDHGSFTYGELLQNLDVPRDPRRMPLLEVAFNCERMDYFGEWSGLETVFEPNDKTHVHYSMFMNIVESKNGLRIDIDYNTEILDESTIARWMQYFENLLATFAQHPQATVSDFGLMDKEQLGQLLAGWNNLDKDSAGFPETSVHDLFEQQVEEKPDQIALVKSDEQIDYRTLDKMANRVANALVSKGVKKGDFVAVTASRSTETIAGLLGILKVGAAYVPIDSGYPEDRIEFMLEDTNATVILSDNDLSVARDTKFSDQFESIVREPNDPAYVIYTSGSTGNPKGVIIPHRAIVRLVKNTNYLNFEDETFLLSAPISFDASTLELWGPLLNGAKLAVLPTGTPSINDIANALKEFSVTTLWLTSGLFSVMMDEHPMAVSKLKQLLAGGDVLSKKHVDKALRILADDARLINGYGPTENTTFTTCHTITSADLERTSIPIGKPISHTQCYILDEKRTPVAPGIAGELYIAGSGLALGYLNQPDLTNSKFIELESGETAYASGDKCRWLSDGSIEFLGRMDRQVKVRGFRIELAEIESKLVQDDSVSEAVVQVIGDSSSRKQLVGYLVPSNEAIDTETTKERLSGLLPAYMVPDQLIVLDSLPITSNGKIDYKALPKSDLASVIDEKILPPSTDTEKKLCKLFGSLLNINEVGSNQNFFSLGGHSLAGLKLFHQIHREFGIELPLATLFEASTPRQLARVITGSGGEEKVEIIAKVAAQGNDRPPLFLVHGGDGGALFYKDFAENIFYNGDIYTVESPLLMGGNKSKLEPSIEATAELYADHIKQVCDSDKIAIGGFSVGGVIALELAIILEKAGIEVERLILFDTNNPANEEQFKNNLVNTIKTSWLNTRDKNFWRRLEVLKNRLGLRIQKRSARFKLINKIFKTEYDPVIKAQMDSINFKHKKLMDEYTPSKYEGETWLFRAQSARFTFDEKLGWEKCLPNLKVIQIKGGHQEIFQSPNIEVLVEKFNDQLNPASK